MGTEDMRAYFAQQLRNLSQRRQFVEDDDSEIMEVFHDILEPDHHMTQTSCDLQWAPLTRHAVLEEELVDFGLNPGACRPTGSATQPFSVGTGINPLEQPGAIHTLDNPRARGESIED